MLSVDSYMLLHLDHLENSNDDFRYSIFYRVKVGMSPKFMDNTCVLMERGPSIWSFRALHVDLERGAHHNAPTHLWKTSNWVPFSQHPSAPGSRTESQQLQHLHTS